MSTELQSQKFTADEVIEKLRNELTEQFSAAVAAKFLDEAEFGVDGVVEDIKNHAQGNGTAPKAEVTTSKRTTGFTQFTKPRKIRTSTDRVDTELINEREVLGEAATALTDKAITIAERAQTPVDEGNEQEQKLLKIANRFAAVAKKIDFSYALGGHVLGPLEENSLYGEDLDFG